MSDDIYGVWAELVWVVLHLNFGAKTTNQNFDLLVTVGKRRPFKFRNHFFVKRHGDMGSDVLRIVLKRDQTTEEKRSVIRLECFHASWKGGKKSIRESTIEVTKV